MTSPAPYLFALPLMEESERSRKLVKEGRRVGDEIDANRGLGPEGSLKQPESGGRDLELSTWEVWFWPKRD